MRITSVLQKLGDGIGASAAGQISPSVIGQEQISQVWPSEQFSLNTLRKALYVVRNALAVIH
jgi:hypothetical protein